MSIDSYSNSNNNTENLTFRRQRVANVGLQGLSGEITGQRGQFWAALGGCSGNAEIRSSIVAIRGACHEGIFTRGHASSLINGCDRRVQTVKQLENVDGVCNDIWHLVLD